MHTESSAYKRQWQQALNLSICFCVPGLTKGGKIESASNSSTSTLSLPRRPNPSDVNDKKGGKNNHQRPQSNTSNSSDQQQQQHSTKRHNEINRQKFSSSDATKRHSDESDDDEEEEKDRKLRHKLLPEGDDFKIVFISSDSSKESELNSSLEACPEPELLLEKEASEEKENDEDDNMEWSAGGHRVKTDFAATSR